MAYDETLADRIRALLMQERDYSEKRMFGGIAFMVRGNMCCGVEKDRLMARVGAQKYAEALSLPHTEEMTFTGKPMKGYVYVDAAGLDRDEDLGTWVARCLDFVKELPPK